MKHFAKNIIIRRLNSKVKNLFEKNEITVIGVTGSVGKTSAKHAIGEVLAASHRVRYSQDSYNTDIGIPLSLFGLKVPAHLWDARAWQKLFKEIDNEIANYKYDTVVLELADDELAMMRKVLKIVKLDISVVSGIAPVHMAKMYDMRTVLHDNWVIAANAKTIIYNADNDALRKKAFKNGTVGFGLKAGAIKFNKISRSKAGFLKAELQIGKQKRQIQTKMLGRQNLYSLLAAAAVANELEMNFSAICFELTQVGSVPGRMNMLKGLNGSKIIDDSYNASLETVIAGLDTLDQLSGRKIAVLGSMNELGSHSIKSHREVGEKASKVVDLLVTIGTPAEEHLASSAAQAGLSQEAIKVFRTPYEAGHYLKPIVKKGDIILVKGSQDGVYSEETARILLDPSLDASAVLVRQSATWKKRKKKAFAL
jgi:UDP-N-acetylmuramoyl-tripeptide--D-alanyl-D-alanine ligase